ncbi:MAG TPA: OmpH family outer membrane protein [Pirellulaceae bacterium]|jgi:Skp family chaperone for outer membrane proteins|nr:OmpH family outer membrane protein [Pirellulaceae bacterium]
MNVPLRFLFSLMALVAVSPPLAAQDKESDRLPVAVLNLDALFKEDPQVVQGLADLKQEAAEIDEKVKLRQTELEAVGSDARKAQPGSQEQRRLQQEFLKLNNELQQYINRERAGVQMKEAKIYLTAYREIESVVKEYCKEKGIKLVIRQQSTSLDENQPAQEIVKALNRLVIYEDGLDITDDIRTRLKAKDKN